MASNDIAIKVEGLSKYYKLGVINNGTLFRDMQSWWARVRGKDDPHAKIGSKYDPTKEGFWALKDLNFEIKKGDRVGIIGHNGAGKSTLLKLLSQITAPTEGSIKINGKIASLLEVGTGFHPEMTGRENIYMNGAILGMSHDEIDKKVNDIIEFSEIGEHIDTPVKRYSSGMYVRLAFAVAAHLDSDILIADEVLAVGDAAFQKKALGKMNELSAGEGRTVLFVSHNMNQIRMLCNKAFVLDHGRVACSGDLVECINFYNGIVPDYTNGKLIKKVYNDDVDADLIEYSIINEKNEILNAIINDEGPFYTQIKVNLKKIQRNFIIFATIFDQNDNLIWVTDIFESGQVCPEDLILGVNTIKLGIPIDKLNNGKYKFSVMMMIHYKRWIVNNIGNCLCFSLECPRKSHPVYEFGNHPMTGGEKPGVLGFCTPTCIIK